MNIFRRLFATPVLDKQVRAEIWTLGARSRGEPLQAALEELKTSRPGRRRKALLRAVIRKLRAA